jgi:uncharacterized membrane protein YfcA
MLNRYILTIILGFFAGITSGSLGVSGAEIILPGLIILNIVKNFKISIGTTLLTILPPLSIGAVYEYYKRKQIDIPISLILMITIFLGAWLGSKLVKDVSNTMLEYLTGFFFIFVGVFFLFNAYYNFFGEK